MIPAGEMTASQDGLRLLLMMQDTPSDNGGCYPTIFTVNGTSYHKICDKARGYQRHTTDAFGGPRDSSSNKNINDYVLR